MDEVLLSSGHMIDGRWQVITKLGAGAFGAIYKVQEVDGRAGEYGMFALKVEPISDKNQVLKMEVYVLETLASKDGRHVCRIEGKGRTDQFNFVIMTLAGKNLTDLRKARNPEKFSLGTALRAGLQCLEALEDLHAIGYLHRDVKPGNYAVGRAEIGDSAKVYILDYGLCRKYINNRNEIRTPRASVGFRGTMRYAAINTHLGREWSRKDDVETWFYQQIEMTKGGVPWRTLTRKDEVGKAKEHARSEIGMKEMLFDTPMEQFEKMIRYIDTLNYMDQPDYDKIYTLMREAMNLNGINDNDPYDWQQQKPVPIPIQLPKSVATIGGPTEDKSSKPSHKSTFAMSSKSGMGRAGKHRKPSNKRRQSRRIERPKPNTSQSKKKTSKNIKKKKKK